MLLPPLTLDDPIPPRVLTIAVGQPLRPVWRNELGGLTYELGTGTYVKWNAHGTGLNLAREAERLAWAGRFTPVPTVLDCDRDDDGEWLITEALPGEMAVSDRWRADPRTAVIAIAAGLRAMHDAMPVDECPFTWSRADRVARSRRLYAAGRLAEAPWHEDIPAFDLDTAMRRLDDPPPDDRLVVCHGDACAPNTLIGDDGGWSGHVDCAALGVADRWADLAIGSWSLTWNFEGDWQALFFDTYGVEPDPARIAYYRLLWDLTP